MYISLNTHKSDAILTPEKRLFSHSLHSKKKDAACQGQHQLNYEYTITAAATIHWLMTWSIERHLNGKYSDNRLIISQIFQAKISNISRFQILGREDLLRFFGIYDSNMLAIWRGHFEHCLHFIDSTIYILFVKIIHHGLLSNIQE